MYLLRQSEPQTASATDTGHRISRHKIRESVRSGIRVAVIVCALAICARSRLAAQEAPSIFTYAPQNNLPRNGRIILSGTGDVGEALREIAANAPKLIGEKDTILLDVERMYEKNSTTQAILAPRRLLRPNQTYRLSTSGMISGIDSPRWRVKDEIDTLPPEWYGHPVSIGGCDRAGESHYAYIALPVDSEETIAVEVLLTPSDVPSDTTRLLLFPRPDIIEQFSGSILISSEVILKLDMAPTGELVSVPDHLILPVGEGRYGGGIRFEAGKSYRISMTGIDGAGNRSEESPEGIIRIPGNSSSPGSRSPTPGGSGTETSTSPAGIELKAYAAKNALIPEFEPKKD